MQFYDYLSESDFDCDAGHRTLLLSLLWLSGGWDFLGPSSPKLWKKEIFKVDLCAAAYNKTIGQRTFKGNTQFLV